MLLDKTVRNGVTYGSVTTSDGLIRWVPVIRPHWFWEGYGLAHRWQGGLVKIACPFCGEEHTHGWEPGLRVPHCKGQRPLLPYDELFAYFIDCDEEEPSREALWESRTRDLRMKRAALLVREAGR